VEIRSCYKSPPVTYHSHYANVRDAEAALFHCNLLSATT
jgi:hypothetical protein